MERPFEVGQAEVRVQGSPKRIQSESTQAKMARGGEVGLGEVKPPNAMKSAG